MDWRQLPATGFHHKKTHTQSCSKAVRRQSWWQGTVWLICRPSRRKPQWLGQSWQPHCPSHQWKPCHRRGKMSPRILVPQTDCQAMAWKTIWWIGFEWVRLLAPRDGRWLPANFWLNITMCFWLDPTELGCTHSMEHMIKVTDDTPFKEWFRWIPLPVG